MLQVCLYLHSATLRNTVAPAGGTTASNAWKAARLAINLAPRYLRSSLSARRDTFFFHSAVDTSYGRRNYLATGSQDSYSGMMTFRAGGNFFAPRNPSLSHEDFLERNFISRREDRFSECL